MPKKFTEADLVEELREITRKSSQAAVAREVGVSNMYISEILSGKKPIGPRLIEFLGYTREVVIRKIA